MRDHEIVYADSAQDAEDIAARRARDKGWTVIGIDEVVDLDKTEGNRAWIVWLRVTEL